MIDIFRIFKTLQNSQMETAIDVQHLPGRIVEKPAGDSPYGARDILRFAHSALWQQAIRDPLFVAIRHRRDHIGANDARLDSEYGYVVLRQRRGFEFFRSAKQGADLRQITFVGSPPREFCISLSKQPA